MSADLRLPVAEPLVGLEAEIDFVRRILAAAGQGQDPADVQGPVVRCPALDRLAVAFGLDEFQRSVLLICAAFELDPQIGQLCARALEGGPPFPTFGLAAAVVPNARAEAFLPAAPLRYWRLVELSSGSSLTSCPVHIDERVLMHLLGSDQLDGRMAGIVHLVAPAPAAFPAQAALGLQVAAAWRGSWEDRALPTLQVSGDDPELVRAVTADAAERLGLVLAVAEADAVPPEPRELDGLARLWWREAELGRRLLVLDHRRMDAVEPARSGAIRRLTEAVMAPLVIETTAHQQLDGRKQLYFHVPPLDAREQRNLWVVELGHDAELATPALDRIVSQFRLPAREIAAAAAEARTRVAAAEPTRNLDEALWEASRAHARPRLGGLLQRIEPRAGWRDLVLPPAQLGVLQLLSIQVMHRFTVHQRWGFALHSARGLGLASLFAGQSGTGKTMAAEVLALELGLDLYRIDLSQVVNKYVGETEKNLGRIFDAAEAGGGILLFDEADALFGKRSEVRDSHDRYANVETGYLLQRMEDYRGLAILTTNMREVLDSAFLRRLRFTVEFPFPDAELRAEIWRRVFPPETPTSRLDFERLAQLHMAGGSIKNIAVNAAFLAAGAGESVGMNHLLAAARLESVKLQRPLSSSEVRGWE